MDASQSHLTQRILQLTLEIVYLLTGEDYGPIKKKELVGHVTPSSPRSMSGGWRQAQNSVMEPPPPSLTHEESNEQKILEVANKIIELLTGEVAVRCQDVAVYLSMEEREYLEGHCDQYKAAMMEEEPPLPSQDGPRKRNPPERCPHPHYSQDSAQEEHQNSTESTLEGSKACKEHFEEVDLGPGVENRDSRLVKIKQDETHMDFYKGDPLTKAEIPECPQTITSGQNVFTDLQNPVTPLVSHDYDGHTDTKPIVVFNFHDNEGHLKKNPNDFDESSARNPTVTHHLHDLNECTKRNLNNHTQSMEKNATVPLGVHNHNGSMKRSPNNYGGHVLWNLNASGSHSNGPADLHGHDETVKRNPTVYGGCTDRNLIVPSHLRDHGGHFKKNTSDHDGAINWNDGEYSENHPTGPVDLHDHVKRNPTGYDGCMDRNLSIACDLNDHGGHLKRNQNDHCGGKKRNPNDHGRHKERILNDRDGHTGKNPTVPSVAHDYVRTMNPHDCSSCTEMNAAAQFDPQDLDGHSKRNLQDSGGLIKENPAIPFDAYEHDECTEENSAVSVTTLNYVGNTERGFTVPSGSLDSGGHSHNHISKGLYSPFDFGQTMNMKSAVVYQPLIFAGHAEKKKRKKKSQGGGDQQLNRRKLPCPICGLGFAFRSRLIIHYRLHTGEKPFSCGQCDKSFTRNSDLIKHRKTHVGYKPFACTVCGKRFVSNTYCLNHQRLHAGEKPFECGECGRSFITSAHLVSHQRIHTGEKPFRCSVCSKSFTTSRYFRLHQRLHNDETKFSCTDCGKCFVNSSHLRVHRQTHSMEKPFSCGECGQRFGRNAHLVTHQRIHSGEKPFSCSQCGKCFVRHSGLLAHQRSHTGERPYLCTDCGKTFIQSGNLARHRRIHLKGLRGEESDS